MRRRDVIRALAAGAAWPLRQGGGQTRDLPGGGFVLDRGLRWRLRAPRGEAVVARAEIAIQVAGAPPVRLRELERVRTLRTGGGRTPLRWTVLGVTRDVEVTAHFEAGRHGSPGAAMHGADVPRISVSVRGLGAPQRLEAVRFFDTSTAVAPPLVPGRPRGPHRALWINGYQSWSACRVAALNREVEATSHWQLAVLPDRGADTPARRRAGGGLALSFGVADGGEGRVVIAQGRVAALSHFGGRGGPSTGGASV